MNYWKFHFNILTIQSNSSQPDFPVNSRINPQMAASTIGPDYLSMMAKRRPINSNIMPMGAKENGTALSFRVDESKEKAVSEEKGVCHLG